MNCRKSNIVAEGKTKTIWGVKNNPALIIIENNKDITADTSKHLDIFKYIL